MNEIILIGAGGHAKSCIDVIEREGKYRIKGLIDIPEKVGQLVCGYKILDIDKNIGKYVNEDISFLITIGQIESAEHRKRIFDNLKSIGANIATVISPLAYISRSAAIGAGSIVMHGAIINTEAVIGENCTINSKALVEHEAVVEDNCHLSTGSIVNGKSVIKSGSFIGSNAVVVNNVIVPKNSFVKAGSLVK